MHTNNQEAERNAKQDTASASYRHEGGKNQEGEASNAANWLNGLKHSASYNRQDRDMTAGASNEASYLKEMKHTMRASYNRQEGSMKGKPVAKQAC